MTTLAKRQQTVSELPWLIGLGVLVLVWLAAWIYQIVQGLDVIGTGQVLVWGVYISTFFMLAGTAGALIALAAGADLGLVPGLQRHRKGLLLGAIALYIAAGFMILMDLGDPLKVWKIVFTKNLGSPFVWDFWALAISVVLAAVYLYRGPKPRWLPILAAAVAGLVVLVEGWILSMSAGSVLWHGGMTPVIFIVEALIAGAALVLIAPVVPEAAHWLRRALLVLLPLFLLLNLFEYPAINYAGDVDARAALDILVAGSQAPLFWGGIVLGFVLPFVMLAWFAKNRTAVQIAAILAIAGVFIAKYTLLIAGQSLPFLDEQGYYAPTLVEIAGVIGIAGLAGFLFVAARRFLPERLTS